MNGLLVGRSVLVLEVDTFIAGYVGAGLTGAGARLVGPARDIVEARMVLAKDRGVDAAVLGITTGTADEWAFYEELAGRDILVAFTSPAAVEPPRHLRKVPHVRKAYAAFEVVEIVAALISSSAPKDFADRPDHL